MIFNDLYLLSYRFIISAYNEAINSNVFFVLNDVQKQKAKNNTREMLAHKWDINNKAFHTVDTEKKPMIVMIIYQAVMISWNSQEERISSREESHER